MEEVKINYKPLLPSVGNTSTSLNGYKISVSTKLLPSKGTLVYEYNPLRNYRLNELRYLFNNKYYTLQELLNLKIFSNIIIYDELINQSSLKKVTYILAHVDNVYTQLSYTTITFAINGLIFGIPCKESFYIQEASLLNNNLVVLISAVTKLGKFVLMSSNGNYIKNYNSTKNEFEYSSSLDDAVTGIQITRVINETTNLNDISYHFKSTSFLQLLDNAWSTISTRIYKYHPGSLVDFSTDELLFSLEHPVLIFPQYAYDGSVNLIMTDGFSKPRLINTRFSATGKNTYLIVDRKGNNDTNIYDLGAAFDIDTSLYKLTSYIPKLTLSAVYSGGQLPVGNYHFYLTYSDSDGNETDFIAESGLISLFIGTDSHSIRQGFRNENSFKGVKLLLSNIDPAYSYVNIYYSRSTSDKHLNSETLYYKLREPVFISNTLVLELNITGYEDTVGVAMLDINPTYQIIDSAETVTATKNMLFFGNIKKLTPNYADLADLALRFTPQLDTSEIYNNLTFDYDNPIIDTYQDPHYIYDKVGYWPEEIYRFGVVFILPDNTLTPVFNVRGINDLSENTTWTEYKIYDENHNRSYIDINENTNLLITGKTNLLENSKGVVRLHSDTNVSGNPVFGIKFKVSGNKEDFKKALSNMCKGYFFVRLRRIPTVLCQAMAIGVEKHSKHPCIPISSPTIQTLLNKKSLLKNTQVKLAKSNVYSVVSSTLVTHYCPYSSYPNNDTGYILESFMNMHRELVHDFEEHLRVVGTGQVDVKALLCPDYDLNSPYYNSIFNGGEFTLLRSNWTPTEKFLKLDLANRHAYPENYKYQRVDFGFKNNYISDVRLLGVEDSTPLVGLGDNLYSGVAGIASMGYKFNYIGSENKITEADNLIRGIWGPFLAVDSSTKLTPCEIYTIMIPGYNYEHMSDYFTIRYSDKTSYHAISNRYLLSELETNEEEVIYRGDCYICLFTHRMNRNFNDDTAPYNDSIVNPGTWRGENNGENEDHEPNPGFEVKDGVVTVENFEHINLGDINAVELGHWVTFLLRSSSNLNIRAIDESDVNELTKTGHGRGFYPYFPISASGSYKTPESLCTNKGYDKSVSDRVNFVLPDIPALKNSFTNRVVHSLPASSDSFKNGFRMFKSTNFMDYQLTYGSITKLIEWKEGLLIVFEHGLGWANVNERALISNASGSNVYLLTEKVLPKDFDVLSDCFGSLWKESIIKTPYAVYGVDTVAKKIWKFDNLGVQCISDKTVLVFLNQNISLTERELTPIIGLKNVKTHYNRFKNDVMFTFYDDLENVQEKVWNLCYNENMLLFVTFYSWVPSYSDNIYNSFFSFDRLTSKWIAKLGLSKDGNDFSQGILLSNNILPDAQITLAGPECVFGKLSLYNTDYSEIEKFELLRDNLQNFKLFKIIKLKDAYNLVLNDSVEAISLVSELYYRTKNNNQTMCKYIPNKGNVPYNSDEYGLKTLKTYIRKSMYLPIYHGSDNRRKELENPINKNKLVYILNVRCHYKTPTGVKRVKDDSIAVTVQYNLLFLSTDFWRHGLAGIIDISEKLKPTHWYGKLHPFEFEFIVSKNMGNSKIFDNLIILSNAAEPESFHYQIDGDSYEFKNDKATMYYRQEATEAFYLYHGLDIEFDHDFTEARDFVLQVPLQRKASIKELENNPTLKEGLVDAKIYNKEGKKMYKKSTILPLYYSRLNSYNEIEDYYRSKSGMNKNYDALSGAEIVRDLVTNTYKIWSHSKAVNIDGPGGRLRGNMLYNEDRWKILINPINICSKNELQWEGGVPPIVTENTPDPNQQVDISNMTEEIFPEVLRNLGYTKECIDKTKWDSEKLIKLRDKYLRVRIRYSGKELAIIQAVQTLFRLSFS